LSATAWSLVEFFRVPGGLGVLLFVPFYPFLFALPGAVLGALTGGIGYRVVGRHRARLRSRGT
jgi:hypothetical protein